MTLLAVFSCIQGNTACMAATVLAYNNEALYEPA
jgi:hypothetical protein